MADVKETALLTDKRAKKNWRWKNYFYMKLLRFLGPARLMMCKKDILYIVVCLTEQHLYQICMQNNIDKKVEIILHAWIVHFETILQLKLTCSYLACITSHPKIKTAHQSTQSRNTLVPVGHLKNLQKASCAVLSNRHRYVNFV